MSEALLLEIGCEEIPARMIEAAAQDLRARLLAVLDASGFSHGPSRAWGGTRRLAVHVEAVARALPGKDEVVLGPPASVAFRDDGAPTPAGAGFAKKQGIDPAILEKIETDKGVYAGFRRAVGERTLQQMIATALPGSITGMSFPKMMRWGTGEHRFVRPVQWVVALHGTSVVELDVLGARAGRTSDGHRFLAPGPVAIPDADRYVETLRAARVLIDPQERREALLRELTKAAQSLGGKVVEDDELLGEVVDLVEWPGVVAGRFDASFLELPEPILVTTLKHHQKSFSVDGNGGLLPAFLSVANTDRDPAGHVRRGNEWVVVGRLEDARFFWNEDRKRSLSSRVEDLERVTYHKKIGSYRDKAQRITALAQAIAERLQLDPTYSRNAARAAYLAKADLVTGLVGEFPELQGVVGGMLLGAEVKTTSDEHSDSALVALAIREHYQPNGVNDIIPETTAGRVVSIADKLDTIASLIGIGETPTGSRDPFGIRRAANGVLRIVLDSKWPLSINDLWYLSRPADSAPDSSVLKYLTARLEDFFRDRGFSANEIASVATADGGDKAPLWTLEDIDARLQALRAVRNDPEFTLLVQLTARVVNIGAKNAELLQAALDRDDLPDLARDPDVAAQALQAFVDGALPKLNRLADNRAYLDVAMELKSLARPVDEFFKNALVIDESDVTRTHSRLKALNHLQHYALTKYFDLRQLAGDAGRRD